MLFDIKKYNSYIESIDLLNIMLTFIITIGLTIIGFIIFKKFLFSLIGFSIGLIISYMININRKIKIEKMKMEIDIYNKIIKNN